MSDDRSWITHLNPRQVSARSRPITEPAPTLLAKGLAQGVPVWDHGENPMRDGKAQDERAAQLSLDEAAALQGFPAGYPFQGSRYECFQQVGNAVPPPLARAVLSDLLEIRGGGHSLTDLSTVDQFAGPGGWDVAARELGIDPLGIEWDDAACATRAAAGLRTLQADVAALDPLDFKPIELQIASPPCPTFSSAGKGEGIADMELVWEAARRVAAGSFAPGDLTWRDARSELVVEPLRWALALQPKFIAWEQVPPVIDFWRYCAEVLRNKGYSVWTGILEAERYGVPQTRERAILMAKQGGGIHPPHPTHQRYVKGEPARHDVTLEGEVLPWVSMAEALGWTDGSVPSLAPTVSAGRTDGGGGVEVFAGADARRRMRESCGVPWLPTDEVGFPRADDRDDDDGDGYRERDRRPASEPAFTLGKSREAGDRLVLRANKQSNSATRIATEPAPTIKGGHDVGDRVWLVDPDPVRLTAEEAAVLQGFPVDYPFRGSRSKIFQQIGNAVPPLLAKAVLSALVR